MTYPEGFGEGVIKTSTYEYRCCQCGYRFEEFQGITADPIQQCPKCGGQVERLLSLGMGFLFKGFEFYTTDYRSESYKRREKEGRTKDNKFKT